MSRSHVPLLPRPRILLPTGSQSPVPRLPHPHSMKYDTSYNLSFKARCNFMKKPIVISVNSNPLKDF